MHNLPSCTVYVELHDIIRISGQISIAYSSRKKGHFCQELIQKQHDSMYGGGQDTQRQMRKHDIQNGKG